MSSWVETVFPVDLVAATEVEAEVARLAGYPGIGAVVFDTARHLVLVRHDDERHDLPSLLLLVQELQLPLIPDPLHSEPPSA